MTQESLRFPQTVHASAINPSDVFNVEGRFPVTTVPRTPGRDFAGVVIHGAKQLRTCGAQVGPLASTKTEATLSGSSSSESVEHAEMPGNISFPQAAVCGVAFLTASMMLSRASLEKGEYVLLLGSSGAVGSAAVQLARTMGALPIPTSRKNDPSAVNITEDLAPQIASFTSGKGITVILDTVGDAALFKKSLDNLAPNGRYVIITAGKTPGLQFKFNALDLYRKNAAIFGVNTLAVQVLAKLKQGFESGVLVPPGALEEVDMGDVEAVKVAYAQVKTGTRVKQILVNWNS